MILDLKDTSSQHILPHIYDVHEYLTKRIDPATSRVLIHCAAGVSRSATLAAGHLMLSDWELDMDSAIEKVKSARSVANPNPGFLRDLYELEVNLYVLKLNETARLGDYISQLKEEL
jgi:protein-tyrosine phosphatase